MAVSCLASDEESLKIAEPILLEQLAMARPKPKPPEMSITFDANAGTYTRDVRVMSPVWSDSAPKAISGIDAFKANKSTTPSYSTPYYSIGEGRSAGFSGGEMTDWKDTVRRGPVLLCIIGGLMLAGGIVLAIWAKQVLLGLAVAGAGMALIVTGVLFEAYPWIALVALAVVVGVAVWWLVSSKSLVKAKASLTATLGKAENALVTVVRGVEASPAEAQATVKASIKSAALATGKLADVKNTVTAVKNGGL